MAVVDSDAAKMSEGLEWESGCFEVRKSGDDAAGDGQEVLGEGRKASEGVTMATAAATRAAEKGGADTMVAARQAENEKMRREKELRGNCSGSKNGNRPNSLRSAPLRRATAIAPRRGGCCFAILHCTTSNTRLAS